MISLRLVAAIALLLSITWAHSQTMGGEDFAATAASSDMFEIRSSELALQNSQNAAIREFAQMMIDDHTAAARELMAAGQQDGVSVPTEMTSKHAQNVQALQNEPAASFDTSYIEAQLTAHQEALTLMTSYAEGGESTALKAHVQKSAPVIEKHLQAVQQLSK